MEGTTRITLGEKIKHLGPGAMIASAVIGPGTVTTCGIAGFNYGLSLCWAVLAACIVCAITQILTTRVALGTRRGLSDNFRYKFGKNKSVWAILVILLFIAIPLTNCGYQAGNVAGAGVGATIIVGDHQTAAVIVIAIIALILLLSGKFNLIKNVLTGLIITMVVLFLAAAVMAKPNIGELLRGMFIPHIPKGAALFAAGMLGTTVGLTNIMLHCSSVATVNSAVDSEEGLERARVYSVFDIIVSNAMTAIVSICIIITGNAVAQAGGNVASAADVAKGLEPLVGTFAKYIFALGIFSAGISSSLTLPMGGAYTLSGLFGFKGDMKNTWFKVSVIAIHLVGCACAILLGGSPTNLILKVQPLGALTLPIGMILIYLLCRDKNIMGKWANNKVLTACCWFMILFTLFMSIRTFYTIFA